MEIPQAWRELSGPQRDILLSLDARGPASGAELHAWIGGVNGRMVKTTTYYNLEQLEADGLVAYGQRDKREREYRITSDGEQAVVEFYDTVCP